MKRLQLTTIVCATLFVAVIAGRRNDTRPTGGRSRMCGLRPEKGPCFAILPRWFFNATSSACEAFTYGGCRGNANRFRTLRHCLRRCEERPCPKLECATPCPSGFRKAPSGCDVCECRDVPSRPFPPGRRLSRPERPAGPPGSRTNLSPRCPQLQCFAACPLGYLRDDRGCLTCRCRVPGHRPSTEVPSRTGGNNPPGVPVQPPFLPGGRRPIPPHCRLLMCFMHCPLGYELDAAGCPTCACRRPWSPHRGGRPASAGPRGQRLHPTANQIPGGAMLGDAPAVSSCPEVVCDMFCEGGFKRDDDSGCEICECNTPTACPEITCSNYCEHGRVANKAGCPTCDCLEAQTLPSPAAGSDCPLQSCMMVCENGFETDKSGCEICQCKEPCPEVECMMHCQQGFEKDSNNCNICKCAQPVCSPINCQMLCPYGFEKDARGCDICQCQLPAEPEPAAEPGCSSVSCRMHCRYGFKKDMKGCEICECKEACSQLRCAMHCEHGFETDEDDCEICRCKTATPTCSPISCFMYCEHGFEKDENGCDICRCAASKPTCSPLSCRMHCPTGFEKDSNGCDICICQLPGPPSPPNPESEPECSDISCLMFCENGFEKDANGCDICRCAAPKPTCSPIMCFMYCKHGFEKDENGCNICRCAAPKPTCSPIMCFMYCEHGFEKDENGCDICRCAAPKPTCSPFSCFMHCQHGFEKDENGCNICRCSASPEEVALAECEPIRCRMACPHGYETDESGCDICRCKWNSMAISGPITTGRTAFCAPAPEVGPCKAARRRWYYDVNTQRCTEFTYGGCRGNTNNFRSENHCVAYCIEGSRGHRRPIYRN